MKNLYNTQYHQQKSPQLVFLTHVFLIIIGSVLFAIVFPNYLSRHGLGFLSSVALVPMAILVQRSKSLIAGITGCAYGLLSYLLFNIWLGKFAPAAFAIVPPIYSVYYIFIFLALRFVFVHFERYTFLMQAMVWLIYEYLRGTGFLGYTFGVLGYSWAFYPRLIQSVSIFGIWSITLFIASISFFIAQIYYESLTKEFEIGKTSSEGSKSIFTSIFFNMKHRLSAMFLLVKGTRFYSVCIYVYVILFAANLVYGVIAYAIYEEKYDESRTVRIALLQHATDPWEGGDVAYRRSLKILTELSEKVLESENPPELVVWPETSFVPSIAYHLKYRESATYTRLILQLMDFLEQYPDTEFLIGNGEGVKMENEEGELVREDYNATLLFKGKENIDRYYKIHLVPFTEYFPYKKTLPFFYNFLLKHDVHFWINGDEHTVFEAKRLKFSTPICFEDGFGKQNATFVKNGASMLINVTDDAWSGVEINAMQHLQLSILRAVENRRTVVRSANSGMTGVIAPSGGIRKMLPSFTIDVLVDDVGVYDKSFTIYTLFNDWFIYLIFVIFFVVVLYKSVLVSVFKKKRA